MSTRTPVLHGHLSYMDTCLTRTPPVYPARQKPQTLVTWTYVTRTNWGEPYFQPYTLQFMYTKVNFGILTIIYDFAMSAAFKGVELD